MKFLARFFLLSALLAVRVCAEETAPLTTARAVRELSVEEASKGLPVRMRGVVTFADRQTHFIADETEGIYVHWAYTTPNPLRLVPGMRVEVTGVTTPGHFANNLAGPGGTDVKRRFCGHILLSAVYEPPRRAFMHPKGVQERWVRGALCELTASISLFGQFRTALLRFVARNCAEPASLRMAHGCRLPLLDVHFHARTRIVESDIERLRVPLATPSPLRSKIHPGDRGTDRSS